MVTPKFGRRTPRGAGRWRATAAALAALCAAALWLASGCGPALYTARVLDAENRLEEAREANARWYAPFEYHYADAHLRKAQQEAAEASYEEAIRYARTAGEYAEKAVALSRERRREGR